MQVTLLEEFRAMLWMLLCGVLCGMQYDVICILRVLTHCATYTQLSHRFNSINLPGIGKKAAVEKRKHSRFTTLFWIAAGDIFFALTAACTFSIFLSHALYGILRWHCLLASLAGYVLYRKTVGRVILYVSEIIAGILRILFRYLLFLSLLPFRMLLWIARILLRCIEAKILYPMRKYLQRKKQNKYTKKIQMELRAAVRLS